MKKQKRGRPKGTKNKKEDTKKWLDLDDRIKELDDKIENFICNIILGIFVVGMVGVVSLFIWTVVSFSIYDPPLEAEPILIEPEEEIEIETVDIVAEGYVEKKSRRKLLVDGQWHTVCKSVAKDTNVCDYVLVEYAGSWIKSDCKNDVTVQVSVDHPENKCKVKG